MQHDEVNTLKTLSLTRYAEDGGTTYECCSDEELAQLIAEHGTAEAAWAWQVRVYRAQYEACAAYDNEGDKGFPKFAPVAELDDGENDIPFCL